MTAQASPDWIAVDWGTSVLRVWLMSERVPLERRDSPDGLSALSGPEGFEPALEALISDWPDVPVVICGMAGAATGWIEAPYRQVPTKGLPEMVRAPSRKREVWIIGGVSQPKPPDVMRGEETQIAGYMARNPDFEGTLCLPGTHCKWARISARELCDFKTVMTGEIHGLLAGQSILRFECDTVPDPQSPAFGEAVDLALSRPHAAWAGLFRLRASRLLGRAQVDAASWLSGCLIGMDLGASREYWLGSVVTIIGTDKLSRLYAAALERQGVVVAQADVTEATLDGLFLGFHSRGIST